ncbi:MAG: hypothetical protein WAT74_10830 [Flavobacteriales bacterium]
MARLVHTLRTATESRRRALRFGWSRRKDHDAVNAAVMACEEFCNRYPGASDALVNNWCRENSAHVVRVVLGGRDKVLAQLIGL